MTVPSTFCAAAVQTVSGDDVAANLQQIAPMIARAAEAGAKLVLLPEYFGLMGARATDKLAAAERDIGGDEDGIAAQLSHRDFKRHAGAQRGLVEQQRDLAPRKRCLGAPSAGGARLLQTRGVVQTRRQFPGGQIGQ